MSSSERAGESKREAVPTGEPRTGKEQGSDAARGELAAVRAMIGDGGEDGRTVGLNSTATAAALRGANRALGNFVAGQAVAAERAGARRPPKQVGRPPAVQAKLLVSDERDLLEREADELADMLVHPHGFAVPPGDDEPGARAPFEWSSTSTVHQPFGVAVPDELASSIEGLETGGQPLSASERAFFEPRLGVDLAAVRVHTDARAVELCAALQARAFTHGRHVVLGRHAHVPGTADARRLMAHELVHVLQQGGVPLVASRPESDAQEPAAAPAARGPAPAPRRLTRAHSSVVSRETFYLGETQDILVGVEVKNGVRYAHIMRRNEKGAWVGVTEVVVPNNEDPKKVALIAVSVTKTHPNSKPGQTAGVKLYKTGVVDRTEWKKEELGEAFYEIDVTVPAGFVVHHNQQRNQRVKHVEKSLEDIEKEQKAEQAERSEVWTFVEQQYKKDLLERMKLEDPFFYRTNRPFGPDGLPVLSDYDKDQISLSVDRKADRAAVINSPEFQKYKLLKVASDKKFEWISNMLRAEEAKGTPISWQEAEKRLKAVLASERAALAARRQGQDGPGVVSKQEDERPLTEQVAELLAVQEQAKDWNAKNEADALAKAAESVGPWAQSLDPRKAATGGTEEVRSMVAYLGQDLPGDSELQKQLNRMVRDNRANLGAFAEQQLSFAMAADPNGPEAQHWKRVVAGRRLSLDATRAEPWRPGIEEEKRREQEQHEDQKERQRLIAGLAPHFGGPEMLDQLSLAQLKEHARKLRWDGKPNREAMISMLSRYLDAQASRQGFREELEKNKVTDEELWEQLGKLGLDQVLSPTEQALKRKYGSLPREKTNEKGDLVGYELTEVKEEAMGGRLRVTIRTIDHRSGAETKEVKVILTPAADFWAQTGDFAIGFVPYVGVAKSLFEAVFGMSLSFHDAAMGKGLREMTPGERIESALGAIPGSKKLPNLAKLGAAVGKVTQVKMVLEIACGYSLSGKDIDLLLAGKPPRKLTREELFDKVVMGGLGHLVSKAKGKFEEVHDSNTARTRMLESGVPPAHLRGGAPDGDAAGPKDDGATAGKGAASKGDVPDGVYLARDAEHYDLALSHPQEKAELHLEQLKGQLGIKATIDPNGGNRIEVKFVGGVFGRVKEIHVVMGPHALATDLHLHLPVIVALKQYQGLVGLGRAIVATVQQRVKGNQIVKPGDPGYRILWETDKLRDLMELRVHELSTARDPARRTEIIEDIKRLRDQMTEWQHKVEGEHFDPYSVEMRNTGDDAGRPAMRPEGERDFLDPRQQMPEDLVAYLEHPDSQRYGAEKPSDPGDGPVKLTPYVKERNGMLSITVNMATDKAGVGHASADFDPKTGELYRDNIHVNPHEKTRGKGYSRAMSDAIFDAVKSKGYEVKSVKAQLYETNFEVLKTKGVYETPFFKGLPPEFKYVVYLGERWFKVYKNWEDVVRDTGFTGPPPPDHVLRPPKPPKDPSGGQPPPQQGHGGDAGPGAPPPPASVAKPAGGGDKGDGVAARAADVPKEQGPSGGDGARKPPGSPSGAGRGAKRQRGPVPPAALEPGVFRSPVHEQLFRWNDEAFAHLESDPAGVRQLNDLRTQGRRVGDQTDVAVIGGHVASTLPSVLARAQDHVRQYPGQSVRMLTAEVRNLSGLNEYFGTTGARQVLAGLFNELSLSMRLELAPHGISVSLVYVGGSRLALVVVGPAKPDKVYAAVHRGLRRARKYAETIELPLLKDQSTRVPVKGIPHPKYPHDPLEAGTGISIVQRAVIDPSTPVEQQIEQWGKILTEQSERAEEVRQKRNPDKPKYEPDVEVPEAIPDVPRPEGARSTFKLKIESGLEGAEARRAAGGKQKPGEVPAALIHEVAEVLREADADSLGLHAPGELIPMLEDAVAWKQKEKAKEAETKQKGESAAVIAFDVKNLGGLGFYLGRDISPKLYKEMVEIIQRTLAQELPTTSPKGCHYGGDEFGFLVVGTFSKDQVEAARIKAAAAVKEWADKTTVTLKEDGRQVPLQSIRHTKEGKLPGTGVTGAVVMIEDQATGRDVLASMNALDIAKAVAKEAAKQAKKGGDPPGGAAGGSHEGPVVRGGQRQIGLQPVGVRMREPPGPQAGPTDDFPRSGQRQQQQQQQQTGGAKKYPNIPGGSLLEHQRPPLGTGRGHPYEHIGRTDAELLKMLDSPGHDRPAATTFYGETSAHFLVDETIEARSADIQRWLSRGPSAPQSFIYRPNPSRPTGRKIERANRKQVLGCDSVVIVLMPDSSRPSGYYILTAYPE